MSEDSRAQVLSQLNILDTPPEERFDRICRQAQEVMGAPATYISLIDRERQWFKSSRGLGEVTETPREGTFCDYAIERSRPTVVLNAIKDPLFARSPYVQEGPQVRFYAGFPLTVQGERVGTLCALDFEAREQVTPEQLEQLYDLARQAEAELERGRTAERRLVTILRSGLRSHNQLDSLPTEVVVAVLNLYAERMLEVVERWQGTLDEASGDSLRVLFGVPKAREDQVLMAAGCAVDMQRTMHGLNQALQERGLAALDCGIALHTAEMVVGEMGCPGQRKSTVAGSAVGLAERMQSLTLGGQILASEDVILALGELAWVEGKLRLGVPGLEPLTFYELAGVGELRVTPA